MLRVHGNGHERNRYYRDPNQSGSHLHLHKLLTLSRTKQLSDIEAEIKRNRIGVEGDAARVPQLGSHQVSGLESHPGAYPILAGEPAATGGKRGCENAV